MIRVSVKGASPVTQAGLERLLQDDPEVVLAPIDSQIDSRYANGSTIDVIVAEADGTAIPSDVLEALSPDGGPVILLLDDPPSAEIALSLRAGIKGVLARNCSAAELLACIHAVAEGLLVLDSRLVENFSSSAARRPAEQDLQEPLTAREAEVLRLLAEGLGNKEIASCLHISEHTAKFHVASILGKLGATTRTEAVTLGIRHGLIMI